MKQVKVLKKIMAGRDKGKRRWHYEEFPKMIPASKLSSAEYQGKEANRRVTVLNKLFMKNVTDLMATGVFAEVLFGYGIQISTVKISPEYKKLNIYWVSNNICDEEVDRRLKSIAGPLRHELSILRLMGEIPQINFCRDKSLARSTEVDGLLKRADFGEDFVPKDQTLFNRSEKKLEFKLSEETRRKIHQLDQEHDEIEVELPIMRHDIFDLDHDRIMKSITASISKSVKAWESYKSENVEAPVYNYDKINRDAELRDDFVKFLEKRSLEKKITPDRKKFHRHFLPQEYESGNDDYKGEIPDDDYIDEEKL
jgi:ribosome-binding factor A